MDLATTFLLGTYGSLLAFERLRPGRRFPARRGWVATGLAFLAGYYVVSGTFASLWDGWLAEHALLDGRGLGVAGGALVGLLVLDLGGYLWHRALHRVPVLWRTMHQTHHAPERLDVASAFVFHPIDVVGWTLVGSVSLLLFVGLVPEAALAASLVTLFLNVFQHANLRTPRWLGYLVHRPESHAVHHERGVHGGNYGTLTVWDLVFGTFRNPATWEGEVGFYDGASRRWLDLLLGRDVSRPAPETERGARRSAPVDPTAVVPAVRMREAA